MAKSELGDGAADGGDNDALEEETAQLPVKPKRKKSKIQKSIDNSWQ